MRNVLPPAPDDGERKTSSGRLHRALRNRQTQPGALRPRIRAAIEAIEDALAGGRLDARSTVDDVHDGFADASSTRIADSSAGRTELDRVVHQVDQRLAHHEPVRVRVRRSDLFDLDGLPLFLGQHSRDASATSSASSRTSNSSVDSLACRVSARDSVRRRSTRLASRSASSSMLPMIVLYAGVVAVLAKPHFADAAHRGEWRAELMRHVGREASHLLERRFQSPERLVEHRRQPPHLVVRIFHGQPIAQPLGGDRAARAPSSAPRAAAHAARVCTRPGPRRPPPAAARARRISASWSSSLPHRRFGPRRPG